MGLAGVSHLHPLLLGGKRCKIQGWVTVSFSKEGDGKFSFVPQAEGSPSNIMEDFRQPDLSPEEEVAQELETLGRERDRQPASDLPHRGRLVFAECPGERPKHA